MEKSQLSLEILSENAIILIIKTFEILFLWTT